MTECDKFTEFMSRLTDGELSDREKAELDEHLRICPSCASLLETYKSISAGAKELLIDPPEELKFRIMNQIPGLEIEKPVTVLKDVDATSRKNKRRHIIGRYTAIAACLALILLCLPRLFGGSFTKLTNSAPAYAGSAAESQKNGAARDNSQTTGSASQKSTDDLAPAAAGNEVTMSATVPGADGGSTAAQGANAGYYATITVKGILPESLKGYPQTDKGNGVFYIIVTKDTADKLLHDGYIAFYGNKESNDVLVIYTAQ